MLEQALICKQQTVVFALGGSAVVVGKRGTFAYKIDDKGEEDSPLPFFKSLSTFFYFAESIGLLYKKP
jgi:hypothetical protein